MAALGAVAVVAALGATYSRAEHERSLVCQGAADRLRGVWDPARRAQVRGAFAATESAGADEAFARAAHALDGYADRWVEMHTDACESTRLRGEQSEELLDLRMQCLAERRDAIGATVDVLAVADAAVVAKASSAVSALPPIDDCANLALLRAAVRPPADPDDARPPGGPPAAARRRAGPVERRQGRRGARRGRSRSPARPAPSATGRSRPPR